MKKLLIMLTVLLATVGCVHKQGGQVTPWEKVTTANAILAQSINTVAHGTIAVQESGLITVQQAAPILDFGELAARDHDKITDILANRPSASNVPALKALIDDIAIQAQEIVGAGGAGVKNPDSQRMISDDIKGVATAADAILTSYIAASGGGQ